MKKWFYLPLLAFVVVVLASACKSEFEKVRASGDTDLIYKKASEFYDNEEYLRAQTLYELIIPAYRGRPELEKVYFTYAYTYYKLSRFVMANYYFKNFSSTFPTSKLKEEADFMAAYSNYQMSPTYRLDQTYSNKAIDEFQTFVNTYPSSDRVKECNRLIDAMRLKLEKKAFEEGLLYFNLRQYQAASVTFGNLLKDFPETNNEEQVRYFIVKAEYELAVKSIYDKQEERYLTTVSNARDFLDKFLDSKDFDEIQSIYDNSVKKLKSLTNGRYKDKGARVGS